MSLQWCGAKMTLGSLCQMVKKKKEEKRKKEHQMKINVALQNQQKKIDAARVIHVDANDAYNKLSQRPRRLQLL